MYDDQSAHYAICGTMCTMVTIGRLECTVCHKWHNEHFGEYRETRVHSMPQMEHCEPCYIIPIHAHSHIGQIWLVAFSHKWHIQVCATRDTFRFVPQMACSDLCHKWLVQVSAINSLPTNDGKCRHDLCELSISLWEFIWGF